MKRALLFSFVVSLGVLGFVAWPQTAADQKSFTISGDIPAKIEMTVEDLDKLPQETVTVKDQDGATSKNMGVLLRAVLDKAGAPTGRGLRGKAMTTYVLAKARDGYEVMFTLAELDPAFGNEAVLLVYKADDKPLFGYQGPFRIVCPADKAGARSIRMLQSLEVVQLRK